MNNNKQRMGTLKDAHKRYERRVRFLFEEVSKMTEKTADALQIARCMKSIKIARDEFSQSANAANIAVERQIREKFAKDAKEIKAIQRHFGVSDADVDAAELNMTVTGRLTARIVFAPRSVL